MIEMDAPKAIIANSTQSWIKRFTGRIGITLFFATFSLNASLANSMYQCTDVRGKTLFTDDPNRCEKGGKAAQALELPELNLHSQHGKVVSEEYYNYAFRSYEELPERRIRIILEKRLLEETPDLAYAAAERLEKTTLSAIAQFPPHKQSLFDGIRHYIFTGDEARTGARHGGQWYFRRGNSISPRFDDAIVVRSAKNYLEKYKPKDAFRTALHELAHAYYSYHNPKTYRAAKPAHENAQKQKLYLNVMHRSGKTLQQGYALKNHREYFAEMLKIKLGGNHYFPFNVNELRQYDPEGYELARWALEL